MLFYPKLGKLKTPVNVLGGVYVRYNAGEALSAELWKNRKGPWNRKQGFCPICPK